MDENRYRLRPAVSSDTEFLFRIYANTIAANATGVDTLRFNTANPDASMKNGAVKITGNTEPSSGGSNSHDNMQPYQTLLYIICVNGLYPTLT